MKRVNYLIAEKTDGHVGVILQTTDVDTAYEELEDIENDSRYGEAKVISGFMSLNMSDFVVAANAEASPLDALEKAIRGLNEFGS